MEITAQIVVGIAVGKEKLLVKNLTMNLCGVK